MWRQGDVLIEQVGAVPPNARRLKRPVLATGDSTGQRHQIRDRRAAQLFSSGEGSDMQLFLEVVAEEVAVVHPEHSEIVLPRGTYRVWRQREFDDRGSRFVAD